MKMSVYIIWGTNVFFLKKKKKKIIYALGVHFLRMPWLFHVDIHLVV
jgi:hypothetical protein